MSSWAGGCSEKSCSAKRKFKCNSSQNRKKKSNWPYQWRENFFSCATRNRESSMGTSVTCCQCLAEVIGGLLAWNPQFHREKCILLLFLCAPPGTKEWQFHSEKNLEHYKKERKKKPKNKKTKMNNKKVGNTGVKGCNVIWAYTSSVSTSAWNFKKYRLETHSSIFVSNFLIFYFIFNGLHTRIK